MNRFRRPGTRFSRVLVAVLATTAIFGSAGAVMVDAAPMAAVQVQCSAPAWNAGALYSQNTVVSHNGHTWRANQDMWPGMEPGNSGVPPWWIPWADLGPCAPPTTTTTAPQGTTTTTAPGGTTTTVPPGQSVEDHFGATGPWAVTSGTANAPGTPGVSLYYPTNLGAGGYDHPIVSFGNGTTGTCEQGAASHTHLASWGIAVVCPNSGQTGTGNEILAAAEWLVDQDSNPASVFFGRLDTSKVGAMGGSQGASGAVHAMLKSNGLITSTVGAALTDPWVHFAWSGGVPDFTQVQDPLLLVSGTADPLTSQGSQQTYYNQVPGPAAKAALVGQGHETAGGDGYVTAWFKYTLEGDQFARSAFVGNPPEIATNAAKWTNWAAKNLP